MRENGGTEPKCPPGAWPFALCGAVVVSVAGLVASLMGYGPFARDRAVRFKKSIYVDAPVDSVEEFLKLPSNWGRLYPHFAVTDVDLAPGFVGSSARFTVREFGMHLEGGVEVTGFVPGHRIGIRESGFCEGEYAFTFEPDGEGTRVTSAGAYTHARHWPIPLIGRTWEWLVLKGEGREAMTLLRMLKAELER